MSVKIINSEFFGKIIIQWEVQRYKNLKTLRYSFEGLGQTFDVDYDAVTKVGLDIDKYFDNCMLLIYKQVMDYKQDSNFRKIVEEDEVSVDMLRYFEKKFDNFHTGNNRG